MPDEQLLELAQLRDQTLDVLRALFPIDPPTEATAAVLHNAIQEASALHDVQAGNLRERGRLRARVAELEGVLAAQERALNFETTCLGCGSALDAALTERERAEVARAAVERARTVHREMTIDPNPSVHSAWKDDEWRSAAYLDGWRSAREWYAIRLGRELDAASTPAAHDEAWAAGVLAELVEWLDGNLQRVEDMAVLLSRLDQVRAIAPPYPEPESATDQPSVQVSDNADQPDGPSDIGWLRHELVSAWHDGYRQAEPLHTVLGMTWDQYAQWVADPDSFDAGASAEAISPHGEVP